MLTALEQINSAVSSLPSADPLRNMLRLVPCDRCVAGRLDCYVGSAKVCRECQLKKLGCTVNPGRADHAYEENRVLEGEAWDRINVRVERYVATVDESLGGERLAVPAVEEARAVLMAKMHRVERLRFLETAAMAEVHKASVEYMQQWLQANDARQQALESPGAGPSEERGRKRKSAEVEDEEEEVEEEPVKKGKGKGKQTMRRGRSSKKGRK